MRRIPRCTPKRRKKSKGKRRHVTRCAPAKRRKGTRRKAGHATKSRKANGQFKKGHRKIAKKKGKKRSGKKRSYHVVATDFRGSSING